MSSLLLAKISTKLTVSLSITRGESSVCDALFSRKDIMQHHRVENHPEDPLALTPNLDWAEEVEREEKEDK